MLKKLSLIAASLALGISGSLIAKAATPAKLLVIHSSYCGHCEKWRQEVEKSIVKDAKIHGMETPNLELYDMTENVDNKKVEKLTKSKVLMKPINAVPVFVALDKNGLEKQGCRMAGYANKSEWYQRAKALIEKCSD